MFIVMNRRADFYKRYVSQLQLRLITSTVYPPTDINSPSRPSFQRRMFRPPSQMKHFIYILIHASCHLTEVIKLLQLLVALPQLLVALPQLLVALPQLLVPLPQLLVALPPLLSAAAAAASGAAATASGAAAAASAAAAAASVAAAAVAKLSQ